MDDVLRALERKLIGRVCFEDWKEWVAALRRSGDHRGELLHELQRLSWIWFNRENRRALSPASSNNPRLARMHADAERLLRGAAKRFRRAWYRASEDKIVPDVEAGSRESIALIYCLDRCTLIPNDNNRTSQHSLGTARWTFVSTRTCRYCDGTRLLRSDMVLLEWKHRLCPNCSVESGLLPELVRRILDFNNMEEDAALRAITPA